MTYTHGVVLEHVVKYKNFYGNVRTVGNGFKTVLENSRVTLWVCALLTCADSWR